MKRLGLRSITTKKYKPGLFSKAPDDKENIMNQDFTTLYTNQKWVMDITYIWTVYDGWTYLASVMDLHSKMIIGYSYQRHMKQEIVLESLRQAVYKTKETKGIIVQSDLGSQYLSYDVERFIEHYEMIHSYSRKGTPYDNAPIESFYSLIKREKLSRIVLKNYEEAKMVIFEYIEGFYNRKRIHSSIDYQTPYQVYDSK
jgi:transposase InsO family protein